MNTQYLSRLKSILSVIVIFSLVGCAAQRESTVTGINFDELKNQTVYSVLPYGLITLPGKWEKERYAPISHQQLFKNDDSVEVIVALVRSNQYEFNHDGQKKGFDFAESYYEWDTDYFKDKFGLSSAVMEKDTGARFILYRVYGEVQGGKFNTFYLVGERNGIVTNLSISPTKKWTDEQKIAFLKALYRSKQ